MVDEETFLDDKMNLESNDTSKRKLTGLCSSRSKLKFSIFHLSLIALFAFWIGVMFALYAINSFKVNPTKKTVFDENTFNEDESEVRQKIETTESTNELITRIGKDYENESLGSKKLILLHNDKVWTKYDKWRRYDWRKCPPKWSNCRITTDATRLIEANAVIYNSASMPTLEHVEKVRTDSTLKRIFLSGLTPLNTTFNPSDYDNFFDMTITYKGESDIRIPYWPNDGLLPAMYRPKKTYKKMKEADMLDLEDEIKNYFKKFGKESFLAFTIKNCEEKQYPNLFAGKLREEGTIFAFAANDSKNCMNIIKETALLPCSGIDTDDCVKHFEKFKFVIVPDENLCVDYTTRDYWKAILAWQTVPMLYGASDYEKYLIPNSYIDMVGKEDYISPSFKKAYVPSQDDEKYYKTFHLWRHEDRIEEFHWPCELCRELNRNTKTSEKIDMTTFWNKDEQCGSKLPVHELMRLQLVRTGVISG